MFTSTWHRMAGSSSMPSAVLLLLLLAGVALVGVDVALLSGVVVVVGVLSLEG